ncbi:MAG: hypothetical protein LBE12_07680 [Planctomycetaceae bacterium]|nr:hypothetical protein [Planctomycetaceae bacterium]
MFPDWSVHLGKQKVGNVSPKGFHTPLCWRIVSAYCVGTRRLDPGDGWK